MKKKLKVLKLLLIVLAGLVIILIASFVISSYTRLSDKGIPIEHFYNTRFVSLDSSVSLTFGDSIREVSTSLTGLPVTVEYKENILTLTDGVSTYTFIVIDESTMFGDATGYMYLIGG